MVAFHMANEMNNNCMFSRISGMGLNHTAAILSQETKVALSYLSSLAPKFFTARSRVVKQSFFSLSGQYGCCVNKAHCFVALVSHNISIGQTNENIKVFD